MRILIAAFILLLFHERSVCQSLQNKAVVLKRVIERNHYSPKAIDDSFSVATFNRLINQLDSRRLFLTAGEYNRLLTYRQKLDDELQGKSWAFVNELTTIYKKSLQRADSIIKSIEKKAFSFSVEETITSSADSSFRFSATEQDLARRWTLFLKLMTGLQVYYSTHKTDDERIVSLAEATKLEPASRGKAIRSEIKSIQKIQTADGGVEKYIGDLYLNAIASAFDPHTAYFSTEGKEEFLTAVSSENYSFGLDIDENQRGQFIIQHLQPGGPAWKSGEIHKGDELLEISRQGKETVVLSEELLEDIYQLLYAPGQETMSFKIRKANNAEKTVVLKKEKIDNEEAVVRSYILTADKKIGYILLPGFYTEWENESGSSCAADVAKEIVKLRKENIDGLILDVRYNSGGSIQEALDLAGIFIDEGPLVAEKERSGKVSFLKDMNRGTIYNGPMVLLVNGQSASASELVAATLQDYNRAVIVGGNTYGKATIQQIFSLDTLTNSPNAVASGADAVKITVGRFFRLNGYSAQLNGVKPDILLPDEFEILKATEKFLPYALLPDTIKKNNYYKPLTPLPIPSLAEKSAARVTASKQFQQYVSAVKALSEERKLLTHKIPLKWDAFEKWMSQQVGNMPEAVSTSDSKTFTVDIVSANKINEEPDEAMLKNISGDIFLQEAYRIITDLITSTKKN